MTDRQLTIALTVVTTIAVLVSASLAYRDFVINRKEHELNVQKAKKKGEI